MKCPVCGCEEVSRNLYMGLPFYLCGVDACSTGWGPGSWLGLIWFNGDLWRYEGMGYWRALWRWLANKETA